MSRSSHVRTSPRRINLKRKNRNSEDIIASVLNIARHGATRSRIMYGSYLSYNQLQKYLEYTIDQRLVYIDAARYYTTTRGLEVLRCFEEVHSIKNKIIHKTKLLSEMLGEENT